MDGAGNSRIENDTAALLPIILNSGTITSSASFINGSGGLGYRVSGDGNGTLF